MPSRPRALEASLRRALREFPVAVVVGLRQVGKTTLVRGLDPARAFVTLDDLGALAAARSDPQGFVRGLPRPVTIDEVQRVPELLLAIKGEVDRRRRPGEFLLTGSARIELRRGVQETLAGRAATLRLRPMTWAEAHGDVAWNPIDAIWRCRSAAEALAQFKRGAPLEESRTLAGGLPEPLLRRKGAARGRWFEEYRASYVERDVPPILRVEEVPAFVRFLSLAASRTAQTTHFAGLAHDVGVSADTGLRWFGVVEATFLADLLPPYFRNIGKRLVKSPKLHFGDTGLAAALSGVGSWEDARRHNLAGALFETLVAQHALAYASSSPRRFQVFHYRTHGGAEVDFVLERGGRLLPIEVKLTGTPDPSGLGGMRSFMEDFRPPLGVLLYSGEEAFPVGRSIVAIPATAFLQGPAR